jgi:hypothetical protein
MESIAQLGYPEKSMKKAQSARSDGNWLAMSVTQTPTLRMPE